MISPHCEICKKEIYEYGAILFSPPIDLFDTHIIGASSAEDAENAEAQFTKKYHICRDCYDVIWAFIKEIKNK